MKKKKTYVDFDDLEAGDKIDRYLALHVYGGNKLVEFYHSHWFVKEKRGKYQYLGPRFSSDMAEAMKALNFYIKHHDVTSYSLIVQMEKGPYSCVAEMRRPSAELSGISYARAWAPTLPLAIVRMLLSIPIK